MTESKSVVSLRGNPDEPCVAVTKWRGPEQWDVWCCVHHHWLNGAPEISVVDRMLEALPKSPEES